MPRPETQAEIHILGLIHRVTGFPGDSNSKESAYNAGDLGSVPGSGRVPGEGNGYPLQYCCLKNPMDRGAWRLPADACAQTQESSLLGKHCKAEVHELDRAHQYILLALHNVC